MAKITDPDCTMSPRPRENNLSFPQALSALLTDVTAKMARAKWANDFSYVFLSKGKFDFKGLDKAIPGAITQYQICPIRIESMPAHLFEESDADTKTSQGFILKNQLPTLCFRSETGSVQTGWTPSQVDMMANDWELVYY